MIVNKLYQLVVYMINQSLNERQLKSSYDSNFKTLLKAEEKREEEKKNDEINVDNFNNGKCSYADVTRGTTEPKPIIDLSVIDSQLIEQLYLLPQPMYLIIPVFL